MSEMWDSVAGGWERNADFVELHMARGTEVLLDAAGVREGAAVLDLATGAGGAGLAAAARVGRSGRVVLADVAPEMAAAAGRRAAERANVTTLVCDQAAIAAGEAEFDAVLCRLGLMFAEDRPGAVREAARVLRPGGRYAAATWGAREANPWLGLLLDAVGEQFGVPFPPPGVPGPFALGDPDGLAAVLEAGGLEDVAVVTVPAPMQVASLAEWWDRVPQLAGPLAIALAGMEPEVRDAIGSRALAAATDAARLVGDRIELGGLMLVASGRVRESKI